MGGSKGPCPRFDEQGDVLTLYSTPACLWCRMLKAFFEAQNVVYEERDVWADADAARELAALTAQGDVPVVRNGSRYVIGFRPDEVLGLAGE